MAVACFQGVSKVYQTGVAVRALEDVTFELGSGELCALVGPSGSGKSTMLGLLGLLDTPTSGRIELDGRDVTRLRDAERTRLRAQLMGFVFQQFNLIASLTALGNVETALLYRGLSAGDRRSRARVALEEVGLVDRTHHRPAELSGGEQQRVALARAVVTSPRLIIADEPTGNLDSRNSAAVLDVFERFVATGVAVLIATHNPRVADRAHRRLRMSDGHLAEGP